MVRKEYVYVNDEVDKFLQRTGAWKLIIVPLSVALKLQRVKDFLLRLSRHEGKKLNL